MEVIEILKKRGTAITYCRWEEVKNYDSLLTEMVKNPNNYDKLTRPVCAFITFESDDGYNEALLYSQQVNWIKDGTDAP